MSLLYCDSVKTPKTREKLASIQKCSLHVWIILGFQETGAFWEEILREFGWRSPWLVQHITSHLRTTTKAGSSFHHTQTLSPKLTGVIDQIRHTMLCQLLNLLHIFLPDRLEELQDLQVLQSHFGNWHFERRSAAKRSAVRTSFSVLIAQFQAQRYRSFVSVHILDVVGLNWIKKPPNGTKCHRNIFTSVVVRASNNQIKATEALFLIGCWHFPKVSEHFREESEACRK